MALGEFITKAGPFRIVRNFPAQNMFLSIPTNSEPFHSGLKPIKQETCFLTGTKRFFNQIMNSKFGQKFAVFNFDSSFVSCLNHHVSFLTYQTPPSQKQKLKNGNQYDLQFKIQRSHTSLLCKSRNTLATRADKIHDAQLCQSQHSWSISCPKLWKRLASTRSTGRYSNRLLHYEARSKHWFHNLATIAQVMTDLAFIQKIKLEY